MVFGLEVARSGASEGRAISLQVQHLGVNLDWRIPEIPTRSVSEGRFFRQNPSLTRFEVEQ
jgi:hypothetical protein